VLDLFGYVFTLLLINLVFPQLSFISSSLPLCCSLFIYQLSVRFNLVVGSLLSSLDFCPTLSITVGMDYETKTCISGVVPKIWVELN